ncbi:MAG: T9SS type A sorting domain-containing protein [Brumimicrobium sp.]
MIKYYILISSVFLTITQLFSQAQVVVNDDAYVTMDGGTAVDPIYMVLDNPNANALVTAGTGGNLISENEYNKLRWNIGGSTGNYEVPYTTGTGTDVKIPLSYEITGAGSGGTHIDFSTYPTNVANTPYPSMVNNVLDQNTETMDNSDYLIDRFWIIDAMNYTNRPGVNMDFGYDAAETVGNIIVPGAILAQRYNTNTNSWTDGGPGMYLFYGTDNGVDRVENANVPGSEMYEAWTLVDHSNPLPVELIKFNAECNTGYVGLEWQTASESNASHFNLEKSVDGVTWDVIKTVEAQGNSTDLTTYDARDLNPSNSIAYYRLVQYDFNGDFTVFDAQSVEPCSNNELSIEVSNLFNGKYQIKIKSPKKQTFNVDLSSMNGKKIKETQTLNVVEGDNVFVYDDQHLNRGMYMLSISNEVKRSAHKIMIH